MRKLHRRRPVGKSALFPVLKTAAPFVQFSDAESTRAAKEAANLRAALDEHSIVAITDPEGRITFANDKFCAISKYDREELIGQDYGVIRSGHHSREFYHELWLTISSGAVWHGEIQNRAKDGSCHWLAATIIPFLNDEGVPEQYVAIGADITEQKRIEVELAEKLRLQQLLADLSTRFVAVPSQDVDAAIEATQQLIVETLGLDRSTLWQLADRGPGLVLTHCWQRPGWPPLPRGFSTDSRLPWAHAKLMRGEILCWARQEDLPPEAARDLELFRQHGPRANVTIPLMANGKVFGAIAFASLRSDRTWRVDEVSELKLVAQIIGNVVSRQRAELREEELRTALAHASRVATLGELTAALAHELNQPLAAILSNAQAARRFLARQQLDAAELGGILDDIVRDDKRAGAVIHNLRAMVSKRPAVREGCCLNELVREVAALMHSEMLEARVELRLSLAPGLPGVEAARVELQQVLVNLLVNALQAMKDTVEGRFIEVETRARMNAVVVIVRDRGQGISPERWPTVFEPFYSTKATGLGMGLSICRRIIESHDGRIEARNGERGGAIFTFILPARGGVSSPSSSSFDGEGEDERDGCRT
jgi:PAS domain S-box-containing protein